MKNRDKILNLILPASALIMLVIIWAISAKAVDNEFLLPTFISTVKECFMLFKTGDFYLALLGTLCRTASAFLFSFAVALLLGILFKKNKNIEKFFSPVIAVLRALPTVAVVLLLMVWTNSQIAPVIVTVLVVLPTMLSLIGSALSAVDENQIEVCKVFGVRGYDFFSKVELPQIMPLLLKGIGTGFSLNLKLMVAAEVLSATGRSIGNMLNTSANVNLETAKMFALVMVTVAIGLIVEGTFKLLSKKAGKFL